MSGDDPRRFEPTRGAGPEIRVGAPSEDLEGGGRGAPAAGVASASDSEVPARDAGPSGRRAAAAPGSDPGGPGPGPGALRSSWDGIALPSRLGPGLLILGDRYEVARRLGKGGMGEVWLVHHRVTDADHALKLITQAIAFDPQVRERFRQEARVMARFSHPNAVTVHDAMIGEDLAYILMEYVPGCSLYDELRSRPGPRPLDWTTRLLRQLCSVLHRAHARGIVHRDLKPSNLMLVDGEPPGSELKVLDFGIAKVLDRPEEVALTRTDHYLGTPYYSGPEQLKGVGVDARSDLYSVGVLLYELLTGLRPFEGPASKQMIDHMSTPPPPFRERAPGVPLPEAIEAVVLGCLAKDPARRPQSARGLFSAFVAALPPELQPSGVSTWGSGSFLGGSSSQVPTMGPPRDSWESSAPETAPIRAVEGPPPAAAGPLPSPSPSVPGPGPPSSGSMSHDRFNPSVVTPVGPLVSPSSLEATPHPRPGPSGPGGAADFGGASTGSWAAAEPAPVAPLGHGPAGGPQPATVAALLLGALVTAGVGGLVAALVLGRAGGGGPAESWSTARPVPVEPPAPFPAPTYPDGYAPRPGTGVERGLPLGLVRAADGVEFVLIPGTGPEPFLMGNDGSFDDLLPGDDDAPAFPVLLTDYYLQVFEVTVGEVERVLTPEEVADDRMAAYRKARDELRREYPADFRRYPAAGVPHDLASRFAERAGGRLPSEAQWEYAARSRGKPRRYVWSDQRRHPGAEVAHVGVGSARDRTNVARPGSFELDRTEQGVHDLTGNLREWCRDPYRAYERQFVPVLDPADDLPPIASIPIGLDGFAIRGSSFAGFATEFRTTRPRHFRAGKETVEVFRQGAPDVGFRIVLEPSRGERPAMAE